MKIAVDIISSALEVLVLYYFFQRVLVNKRKSIVIQGFAIILCFSLFTLSSMVSSLSSYAPALNLLILLLYPFIIYKEKILKTILYSALIYIFGIMAEIIVGVVLSILYRLSVKEMMDNLYIFLQCMVLSKLLQFLILRVIGFFKVNNRIDIKPGSLVALLLIPSSGIISIYYFSMVAYLSQNLISNVLLLCLTVITILSNVATFYLLDKQIKLQKSEDMLIMMEKQYETQKSYYSELKQNMTLTNKRTHDLKNIAISITSYLKSQKVDAAISKMEDFFGSISVSDGIITGNDAVDALIQTKLRDVNEEIPKNKISIALPEELRIDEIDLCILIGNAIDNALEACRKITEIENRYIEIRIYPSNEQISVLVRNSRVPDEMIKKSGLKTTKKDALLHGFGIENMRSICQKYGGDLTIEQDENNFNLWTALRKVDSENMISYA